MAAGLVSFLLHTTLLLAFGLVASRASRDWMGAEEEVRIGSLPRTELNTEELPELSEPVDVADASQPWELAELDPRGEADRFGQQLDVALDVALAGPGGAAGQFDSSALNSGAQGGMAQQASFMGLQAHGRRFCIIADCSGSMKKGKLEHVKREILKTVGGLTGGARFQIYFFNNSAIEFPSPGWRVATKDVGLLREWLAGIAARGGTDPSGAFQLAFRLRPPPDAIFFMTDGRFDESISLQIQRLNIVEPQVPVHTITFVDRGAALMMRKIAASSGGSYRHVAGF